MGSSSTLPDLTTASTEATLRSTQPSTQDEGGGGLSSGLTGLLYQLILMHFLFTKVIYSWTCSDYPDTGGTCWYGYHLFCLLLQKGEVRTKLNNLTKCGSIFS
jgi:hypothetical protein